MEQTEGPLLILAGAGTGKTSVLTTRFAHLLLSHKAYPSQILAVTFTNKAAKEMKERISNILQNPVEGLWLGTFHSICVRILRRHAALVGLEQNFLILDTDDQLRLIKQIMAEMEINPKILPPQKALNDIQLWKDQGLTYEKLRPSQEIKAGEQGLSVIYQRYQERLAALNACDFGDLMLHVTEIFIRHPDVLEQYQRRFRYIMVDEYQDTNAIQYLWLRLLSKRNDGQPANIACVGDDDQSIYSWRGADVANILRFQKDFPGASIVRLERNYRSTPIILKAASRLIAHNRERLGKELCSAFNNPQSDHDLIKILSASDSDEEAILIAEEALRAYRKSIHFGEMAILVRAGYQTRAFEEAFVRQNLPYRIIGGLRFYERAEIRDCIAYMRALIHPADDLAFERIINLPRRGMGTAALGKLRTEARASGCSLQQALENRQSEGLLSGKKGTPLLEFLELLTEGRKRLKQESHRDVLEWLFQASGYEDYWKSKTSADAPGRLENIQELLRAVEEFDSLEAFLEHIALVMDVDSMTEEDSINLMTLHAAKGLEFDLVFLPGWEEGIFPSQRSLDERGTQALEEERRLAYVGLTRARKTAIISHAERRRIYGTWQDCLPSRFLAEIPKELSLGVMEPDNSYSFGQKNTVRNAFFSKKNTQTSPPPSHLSVGMTVIHRTFGEGVITEARGSQVSVAFEDGKTRCLLSDYITPKS